MKSLKVDLLIKGESHNFTDVMNTDSGVRSLLCSAITIAIKLELENGICD